MRKFVEHHEGLTAFEHRVEIGRAWSFRRARILTDRLVKRLTAHLECNLAPEGKGQSSGPCGRCIANSSPATPATLHSPAAGSGAPSMKGAATCASSLPRNA